MDIEILELCKENIQPLKRGRKASQFGLALQAEVNVELQEKLHKEREELELAIMTYDGSDPLQPRYEYVNWLEQTCIKHGRECNLIPLLEDTIMLFKDDNKYKQDRRFAELIVKYIEAQENPVELFQMIYSQGIATMCAILYKSWAEVLDQLSDFKRADQIYQLGIANHAEPLNMLTNSHAQFQLSVARRMMLSGNDFSTPQPQVADEAQTNRVVLCKLKSKPGSVRHPQGAPGVLATRSYKLNGRKNISIFTDDENNYEELISAAKQNNKLGSIATNEKNKEENVLKPEKWNKAYNRKEGLRLPSVPSTPSFKVLADPDVEPLTPKPVSKAVTPNVLKIRKAEFFPSAMDVLSNNQHSARKGVQAYLELYSGGCEFSFEELRAAYYRKRDHNDIRTNLDDSFKEFDLNTPLRNVSKHIPFTPLSCNNRNFDSECETPATHDCSSVGISEKGSEFSYSPTDVDKIHHRLEKGSLNFGTSNLSKDFMPITPSLKGIDIPEFETPSREMAGSSQYSKSPYTPLEKSSKEGLVDFKTSNHEDIGDTPKLSKFGGYGRVTHLPTIEESQEVGFDKLKLATEETFKGKKQLFNNDTAIVKDSHKDKFDIFIDDDQ